MRQLARICLQCFVKMENRIMYSCRNSQAARTSEEESVEGLRKKNTQLHRLFFSSTYEKGRQ
jgi:hypothetical protein